MPVESNEKYHVILIDSNKSGAEPRGQKDAFPIEGIRFPDPGSKVSLSDNSTYVSADYPLFSAYDGNAPNTTEASAELVGALSDVLDNLRKKQEPTKITLMSVKHQDKDGKFDVTKYEPYMTVELDKATIHLVSGSQNTYQVQADEALLGTGDKATVKTKLDYKNRV
jgi:hypothetical protein